MAEGDSEETDGRRFQTGGKKQSITSKRICRNQNEGDPDLWGRLSGGIVGRYLRRGFNGELPGSLNASLRIPFIGFLLKQEH